MFSLILRDFNVNTYDTNSVILTDKQFYISIQSTFYRPVYAAH